MNKKWARRLISVGIAASIRWDIKEMPPILFTDRNSYDVPYGGGYEPEIETIPLHKLIVDGVCIKVGYGPESDTLICKLPSE